MGVAVKDGTRQEAFMVFFGTSNSPKNILG